MTENKQAWAAFVLASALMVGTLWPVLGFGYRFIYFPVALLFGCDAARNGADCLRIQLTPFAPPGLTILAFIFCRNAIYRGWYVGSVLAAASACGMSWGVIRGFG
jgi:hypothetical protein